MSVPAQLRHWLFDKSSLTARLIRESHHRGGSFSVRLIDQSWHLPSLDERQALGMSDRQYALIRQVKLYCDDDALVYARTVIPTRTLTGSQRSYASLGNRPLGAMLFADTTMRREQMMVSKLQPGDTLFEASGADEEIWGRRSVFYVGGKPLLVSEYFLPELLHT